MRLDPEFRDGLLREIPKRQAEASLRLIEAMDAVNGDRDTRKRIVTSLRARAQGTADPTVPGTVYTMRELAQFINGPMFGAA